MTQLTTDVAIIGGGVSGLYAGYRLRKQENPESVTLFEASKRIGGRLWSERLPGVEDVPAELGGMFFSDLHTHVFPLINDELGLKSVKIDYKPYKYFLRKHSIAPGDFTNGASLPYFLEDDEKGKQPVTILIGAVLKLVPELTRYLPLKPEDFATVRDLLRNYRIDDTPLYCHGFWNLLTDVISDEAYEMVRAGSGAISLTENSNAYDSIWELISSNSGEYHHLVEGYQQLPLTLAERFREAGGEIHMNHCLASIALDEEGALLTFDGPDGIQVVRAKKVICAMPPAALKRVILYRNDQFQSWPNTLDSVIGVPAVKIFAVYPEPWWQKLPGGPGHIQPGDVCVSLTNLPIRACHYSGASGYGDKGAALVMASYADAWATDYWCGFSAKETYEPVAHLDFTDELSELHAPKTLVKALHAQLEEMHETKIPEPSYVICHDWCGKLYGGGWHLWQPHVKSWELKDQLLQPLGDDPVYICGEAFSEGQGWVEGALATTEKLLQTRFSLEPPAWLADSGSQEQRMVG